MNEFKYLRRWLNELSERPALQKGMAVGSDLSQDYSKISKEDITRITALLYNQRARPAPETGGLLD
jgi:GST-like protein